jgi:hypothetical protein
MTSNKCLASHVFFSDYLTNFQIEARCIDGNIQPTSPCNLLSLTEADFELGSNQQQGRVFYTTKITIPMIASPGSNDYFIDFLWSNQKLVSSSLLLLGDIQANGGATLSIGSSTGLGLTPTSSSSIALQTTDSAPPAAIVASTTASSVPSSTNNALANFTNVNGKTEPASSSSSSSSSSELSTGAKAGIGIGAAVGALAILGLIFFFVVRNRRNKRRATHEHTYGSHELSPTATGELGIEKELNVISSAPVPAWHGDAGAAGTAGETSHSLDRSGSGAAASADEDRWSRGSAGLDAAAAGAGAAGVALASNPPRASDSLHSTQGLVHGHEIPRRPVGGEAVTAAPAGTGVLTDEERARWEEEERRLDEDIAEAERRRGGSVG